MTTMMRLAAVWAVLMPCSSELGAQTTIALRAGLSMATMGGSDAEAADTRPGFNVGGAVVFDVGENVGIQLGVTYVQKGATFTWPGFDFELALDYVEVPLLLRLAIPTEGWISPHFVVGPVVSFEAKCELAGSFQGESRASDCDAADVSPKSRDFGGMVGAGVAIETSGAASLTLDAAYDIGLSSIADPRFDDDVKNRAWSLLAGIAFPVG